MRSRLLRAFGLTLAVCTGAVCAASASAPAAPTPAAASAAPTRAGASAAVPGAISARGMSILGNAWYSDNSPIPQARLRLRNVLTGRIEASTVSNNVGQFEFDAVEGGSYLIELVTETGKLLTIGHTFTIGPGETVATFVRLATKVPWFNGFFGNAGSAVSAAAASIGVTAVAPQTMTCVSACPGGQ